MEIGPWREVRLRFSEMRYLEHCEGRSNNEKYRSTDAEKGVFRDERNCTQCTVRSSRGRGRGIARALDNPRRGRTIGERTSTLLLKRRIFGTKEARESCVYCIEGSLSTVCARNVGRKGNIARGDKSLDIGEGERTDNVLNVSQRFGDAVRAAVF